MEKDIVVWIAFVGIALVVVGTVSMVADDHQRREAFRECLAVKQPGPYCDDVIRSQL